MQIFTLSQEVDAMFEKSKQTNTNKTTADKWKIPSFFLEMILSLGLLEEDIHLTFY